MHRSSQVTLRMALECYDKWFLTLLTQHNFWIHTLLQVPFPQL